MSLKGNGRDRKLTPTPQLKFFSFLLKIMLSDSQVFIALFVALITGVLAVRLGTQLYK